MLTLYHAPRSRSSRIVWLLEELGVPYTLKVVNIRRADGSGVADPANPHPHGKVPTLTDDGALIFESPAIALYLTDRFPDTGLGPRVDDHDRGAYLTWLAWYTGVFEPSLTAKFLKVQHVYGTFGWAPFDDVLAYFSATIAKNPYVLGDRFSAADIIIGGSLPFLMGRVIPESDELKAYVMRITERPAHARARSKDSA
jgi:glutathione S-transferase